MNVGCISYCKLLLCVFSLIFETHGVNITTRANSCDIQNKVDCYPEPGSNEHKCLRRGCCWQVPPGRNPSISWCYFKAGHTTTHTVVDAKCNIANEYSKIDCYPEPGASQANCLSRGCCWHSSNVPGIPYCYYQKGDTKGYKVEHAAADGSTATLKIIKNTHWPNNIQTLKLDVYKETPNRLHFKITDPNNKRYEVPIKTPKVSNDAGSSAAYDVHIEQTQFGIVIKRKSTGVKLFDTTISPMIFADQFIQISTSIPTSHIYGLGEHRSPFWLDPKSSPLLGMWARDIPPSEHNNLYGSHPFFLAVENDGNAFGVFLLNSNGMEIQIFPTNPVSIRYRAIGGILDFYVFTGPSPNDVIKQYTDVIGKPMLPPYWSLGFHNCRWGYGGNAGLRKVLQRLWDNGVPFDTQWADIDYMDGKLDFTHSQEYSELPAIVKDIHAHGQKFVPIVDPGISNKQGYTPFEEGIADDIFIKTHDGKTLIGKVWPGTTAYPDFTNPKTEAWWERQAKRFHDQVPFDGIWIDMNEPSNFVQGSTSGCTDNSLDRPPFTPAISGRNLIDKTICPSAKQHLSSHYNLHNLYGHFEGKATNQMLTNIRKKRPFVLSRSTFPGSGQYVAHWEGDNNADWHNLQLSIPEIMNFNMFGIPFVGADICGFQGRTTDELCTRWMQLGTFYPFMRNHRDINGPHQDPMSPEFSSVTHNNIKKTLLLRYRMLPFFYTAFYNSHTSGKGVVRPLFFQYPHDKNAMSIDNQFMWTDSLLVSPVIKQGATSVEAYFPNDRWFDLHTGVEVLGAGSKKHLHAPMDMINVHIRGGSIIPTQDPGVTTTKSRANDFSLMVAPSSKHSATGTLFWDDGDALDSLTGHKHNLIEFHLSGNKLTIYAKKIGYHTRMNLGTIAIYGVANSPSRVLLDGNDVQHTYDSHTQVVKLTRLNANLLKAHTVTWS